MKANRSVIRVLVLSAVTILSVCLSGCLAYQNDTMQSSPIDAENLPQLSEKVRLEGLRFKPDSARVRGDSKPILDAAAELLRREPDKRVYVDAYCDQLGTESKSAIGRAAG
jgi:outer membrane protein OmpA-like peptidoglycan-associated protein